MTEPVMFFGIGFFVAALLGLLIVFHVHNRSARFGSVHEFQADVRQLEEQLAVALGERSKLQSEIAAMKRDAELTWAAERVESALFRERINDVVHEVVRITRSLETPGSSIEPIPADVALKMTQGTRTLGVSTSVLTMHTGALADRMLALRTTVSRRRSELKALQHDVVKTTSAFVDASDVDAMRMHSVCRSSTDVEQTKRV